MNSDNQHIAGCEDGPAECRQCAAIVAGRELEARFAEARENVDRDSSAKEQAALAHAEAMRGALETIEGGMLQRDDWDGGKEISAMRALAAAALSSTPAAALALAKASLKG